MKTFHLIIVLIHGSTGTGRSNGSLVAPILAREYRIIVGSVAAYYGGRVDDPNEWQADQALA